MAASSASVSFPSFKLKYLLIFTCLIGIVSAHLSTKFYDKTCPKAVKTITKAVDEAVSTEPRMGASLLRLHFHDCFVQGCDASVLLDDTENFTGEKNSFPNANSLRGFEVIDNIKSTLEKLCPATVSCADILAVAASESVGALGGQRWNVPLGRRDSITASLSESNSDLPAPFLDLNGLITAFAKKNFTTQEMVILSGAHTIGQARCTFFRGRIYNESNIDSSYAAAMQAACPFEGGDGNLSPFDTKTSATFDNAYYQNLVNLKGLLHSDQQLFVNGSGITDSQVSRYSRNMGRFKKDFSDAMLKMSMLTPLTASQGQIRTNCHFINA
ncbi:putative peroxidase [Lupinus albus]|uniref:Peroxidase n=1 Tax=Lupinus albus TaxID=3870 RepID=A0A6A4QY75_LUPAL|nr:putative peroxidase [Lupinus albus]